MKIPKIMLTSWITAPDKLFVAKNPENRTGIVHGNTTPVGIATHPNFILRYVVNVKTIGVIMNGINISGLKTIGNPNIIGSLMLNNDGATASGVNVLISALDFFNRIKINIAKTNDKTDPEPPIKTKLSINEFVKNAFGACPC